MMGRFSGKYLVFLVLAAALLFNASFSLCTESPASALANASASHAEASPTALTIGPCDGFDFLVGPPNANKYYNAQPFGKNSHLGDDWNGVGGGNTDKGDPVYSAAYGLVRFAKDVGPGWGNVMRIVHNIGTEEIPELVESLYGHLDTMWVKNGDTVQRGQQIGTIGDAHGAYWAHLHFEMRDSMGMPVGGGYASETAGYLDPTTFIQSHRPKKR